MTKTKNQFHFPEGFDSGWVDTSYCDAQFNIGEKIIIEGEETYFVVTDIQNQFKRDPSAAGGQALTMIMRNVILEVYEPNE